MQDSSTKLAPVAYRWRWSKGQKFQLAHKSPHLPPKMGRMRPQPDIEPLYGPDLMKLLEDVEWRLSQVADHNAEALVILQYIQDELA
jgi:hypothetical protein